MAIQALKGTSVTITETFMVDGTPTDLDSGVPVVHAFFPDGTELSPAPVASGSWTGRTTGQYRIVLDQQPEVTYLDPITWVGTIGGKQQTLRSRVEWVGALLFNLADVRAVKVGDRLAFTDPVAFPNELLLDVRAEILDDFEARTGYSFVPRYTRERHSGDGDRSLFVRKMRPGDLLNLTVDGVAQTLADFDLEDTGQLTWYAGRFPTTRRGNVWVSYVRGWDRPPAALSRVGLARAAMLLLPSQVGSTAAQWTTPDGATFSYDPAGRALGGGTNHYGVPKIAEVLNHPSYSALGMAIA